MKKQVILFLIAAFSLTVPGRAQTDVDLDAEVGGRISLSVDKKLTKGLHVTLEEEVRWDNGFRSFDRFQTTLAASYKLHSNIKIGVGYALISPYSSTNSAFKSLRHRFMVDVTGNYRFGDWSLSLKERFQATYRSGDMNEYQNPRTAMALKSRLKLTYKAFRRWEPYLAFEVRNTLNAPVIKANFDGTNYLTDAGTQKGEEGWFLDGFSGWYVNRLRGILGVEYKWSKNSLVELSVMADYLSDKVVDANAEGTKLKSYTRETGFCGWFVAGYSYLF